MLTRLSQAAEKMVLFHIVTSLQDATVTGNNITLFTLHYFK
jgi:hypothetical protein